MFTFSSVSNSWSPIPLANIIKEIITWQHEKSREIINFFKTVLIVTFPSFIDTTCERKIATLTKFNVIYYGYTLSLFLQWSYRNYFYLTCEKWGLRFISYSSFFSGDSMYYLLIKQHYPFLSGSAQLNATSNFTPLPKCPYLNDCIFVHFIYNRLAT